MSRRARAGLSCRAMSRKALVLPVIVSISACCLSACGSSEASAPTTPEITEAVVPESIADPTFIEAYALTRRFNLGQPGSFTFTPDHTQLLFLRSEARRNVNDLYSLDLASGTERITHT